MPKFKLISGCFPLPCVKVFRRRTGLRDVTTTSSKRKKNSQTSPPEFQVSKQMQLVCTLTQRELRNVLAHVYLS